MARKLAQAVCQQCGRTFTALAKNIHRKGGGQRFCNRACFGASRVLPLQAFREHFWARVNRGDGCWLWTGAATEDGYGQVGLNGITRRCTRVAWWLTHGEWPDESLNVCHTCDNPQCVRPDHLFLGTDSDNMRDAIVKGRHCTQTHPEKLGAHQRAKTHCKSGHPYDETNTRWRKSGKRTRRVCRQCEVIWNFARRNPK